MKRLSCGANASLKKTNIKTNKKMYIFNDKKPKEKPAKSTALQST